MVHYQGVVSFEFQTTQRNQKNKCFLWNYCQQRKTDSSQCNKLQNNIPTADLFTDINCWITALIEIDQTKRASESKLYLYQKKRQQLWTKGWIHVLAQWNTCQINQIFTFKNQWIKTSPVAGFSVWAGLPILYAYLQHYGDTEKHEPFLCVLRTTKNSCE